MQRLIRNQKFSLNGYDVDPFALSRSAMMAGVHYYVVHGIPQLRQFALNCREGAFLRLTMVSEVPNIFEEDDLYRAILNNAVLQDVSDSEKQLSALIFKSKLIP